MKSNLLTAVLVFYTAISIGQTKYASINGLKIAYETLGESDQQPIILINGTGACMSDWPKEFCNQLVENGYFVIRFDNRDSGLSSKFDSLGKPNWEKIMPYIGKCSGATLPYSISDMSKDVTGLMDYLKIEKAIICGISMGGAIAQIIAINNPDYVEALICIASTTGNPARLPSDPKIIQALSAPPPATDDPDSLAGHMVAIYKVLGSTDKEGVLLKKAKARIQRCWYPEGTERQVAAITIGDYCDRRSALSKLKVPTLVLHGGKDPLIPVEEARSLHEAIPQSKLIIVKGLGHDLSNKFIPGIFRSINTWLLSHYSSN
ncbi:alpha/beta fold hydrolase [Galbibacter pacificus]|uniref:Alpha/beta hydrolase n=1 Tax=Galbibacter pacificus TaxID=2996052 RepID=A0ABT6FRE8_9FLAO|nr:alpha/beta hydrolase [Galbibacter pacificus]MDG3581829.1 alpha/beta hydrolase [Galbibacter pacificus]MDG3585697.1 alpha/beta hydrolase [Galbibacter pacificus]